MNVVNAIMISTGLTIGVIGLITGAGASLLAFSLLVVVSTLIL